MRRGAAAAAAGIVLLLGNAALAQETDFSVGSEAEPLGLYGEVPARFTATVVDPLCELAGDCPADCGGGTRQLALLRSLDGVLILPLKNVQPAFSGAANELRAFCGQEVEVDGMLIEDEDIGATNVYQVQRLRAVGDAEWTKANRWTRDWAEANPDAAGEGPWFRRDPRILADIAASGYLGLGLDEDARFIAEELQ